LTAEEVADRLDVGVKWVWAQARAGRIPHVKLGRYKRFRSEAIEAWLAQLEKAEQTDALARTAESRTLARSPRARGGRDGSKPHQVPDARRARRGIARHPRSQHEGQAHMGAGLCDPLLDQSNVALGREFGVSDSLISRIRRGLIWTDEASTENIYALVDRVLILMAAMTGGRQGEMLALRWRDVDWFVQQARIRRAYVRGEMGSPKSKRSSRGVPLAMRVAGALDDLRRQSAYQHDDDLVFGHPHTGQPLDRSQVLKRFKRYLKDAGIRSMRFHDLRHTFGTTMAASGVAMRTLQEWMGHADIKTTQIYADYAPAAHEAAIVEAAFTPPEPTVHRRNKLSGTRGHSRVLKARPRAESGLTDSPSLGLWSRRSRARIPSLTPKRSQAAGQSGDGVE
jgi:excisionase family DNA binding protein